MRLALRWVGRRREVYIMKTDHNHRRDQEKMQLKILLVRLTIALVKLAKEIAELLVVAFNYFLMNGKAVCMSRNGFQSLK